MSDAFDPQAAGLEAYALNEGPVFATGEEGQPSSMLMRLLMQPSARRIIERPLDDNGMAEHLPYPFMALVGQQEMRTALLLTVVNPNIGGALLIGPRGIGKTTAARGLSDLLPFTTQSICGYGCLPEDYAAEGPEGVCQDCAARLERGEPITTLEPVKLTELPLNARLEDVIGSINERAALQRGQARLERGILARADGNLLYIDEVNLLQDDIMNAILDAAAQGTYTVRRGPLSAYYRARFTLIGSMNPEEGSLRPQILDRFGLRVISSGLVTSEERRAIYERMRAFRRSPRAFMAAYAEDTAYARDDVIAAREWLPGVELTRPALDLGLSLVQALRIHSHRAEFTLLEAARAHAALDQRSKATVADVRAVAPMALRLRRSTYIDQFIEHQKSEEDEIQELLQPG